jgi:phasin
LTFVRLGVPRTSKETTMKYEIPNEMRDIAEKSVEQARKAVEGFIGAAQKAVGQADSTTTTMQTNARAFGDKAMTFAEQNVRSAFDYAQRLVRATDMQEILSLQADYVRSQMAAMQDQAKELGSTVQSAAQSTVGNPFSR